MNDTHEFDEIARRKLQERTFAFEEAQWSIVERSLTSKDRSRRGIVFFAIAALFIGTGVIWWGASNTAGPVLAERASDKSSPVANEHGNGISGAVGDVRTSATTSSEATESTVVSTVSTSEHPAGRPEPKTTTVVVDKGSAEAEPTATKRHEQDATPSDPKAAEGIGVLAGASVEIHDETQHIVPATGNGVTPTDGVGSVSSGSAIVLATETPLTTNGSTQAGEAGNGEAPGQVTSASPVDETVVTGTIAMPADDATDHLPPIAQSGVDTAATTPPMPSEVPGPLGRWELSLLAGGFSTLNHYSWNGDTDPGMEVQRAPSAGYGAELMKMGAHFGWGSGLHYSSYAEQIKAGELSNTEQVQSTSYYLMPVDTTILVIIDTVMVGGIIHYVTGQVDTTFNVLASQTVTNTLTHQQREARELVNRVSYLEIPVLFDAHVRSGHWNFGVRGGPTIGFLTSSRGSLPNAALDGYVDLRPEELRSTVFGYMARVYVHFALNDAWAIGVEPTAKGQLTSTLMEGDVARKSSALGAFLSVTHRLR